MTGGARGELLESGVVSPLATLAVGGTTDGCSKAWVMLGNIPGSPAEGEPEGSTPGDILFIIGGGGKLSIPADTFGELWPEFSSSSSLKLSWISGRVTKRHLYFLFDTGIGTGTGRYR